MGGNGVNQMLLSFFSHEKEEVPTVHINPLMVEAVTDSNTDDMANIQVGGRYFTIWNPKRDAVKRIQEYLETV